MRFIVASVQNLFTSRNEGDVMVELKIKLCWAWVTVAHEQAAPYLEVLLDLVVQ
jgi:hypothetical protein